MLRRSLLSAEQRARLFDVPTTPAEMATHYVLSPEDLLLVLAKRLITNRFGFAVQLCLLRHPGQGLDPGQQPPLAMLEFVAGQLGIPTAAFADYARRDQTRREHAAERHTVLGLRSLRLSDWRDCLRISADAAWATDRGEPIVQTMLSHLRARGVLVPDAAVLERIGLTARARARQQTFHALADGITEDKRTALDDLLVTDPVVRRSRFAWLRDAPEAPAPANMVALLDRLDWVRDVGIAGDRTARIHPARLARLVEEGDIMTAQHLANVEPLRRTALLVAGVADLETRLTDATLAMFCKYVGSLFTKARGRDERRFQTTKRDVARTLLLFRRTIAALKRAKETGEEGVAAVEREVGMGKLDQALPVIDAVAGVADVEILATAAEKYAVVRRFSPRFLAAFRFQSSTPHDPLLAAIDLLNATDESGARVLPKRLPSAFLAPRWRRMIFAGPVPDRRLYETAVLAVLRDRLRGAGVWVAGSRDHRAFEDYLLAAEPAETMSSGIAGEADPVCYVAARAGLLHERLQFVAACAARGELDGVEIEDGSLDIARTKPTVPDAARLMAGRLYGMLPRVRVTEVVADVADMTGFAACFTHLRTGNPPGDLPALYAALLADGTNLGLSRMADATRGLSYHHLVNVAQWHVNEDNYTSGRAAIVEAHHRHPMSAIWGDGTDSSSDGQYFRAGGRAGPGGDVNAKSGIDPGVVLYTTQSGQYGPMHTRVISATAGEAPYVLDGLHPQAHRPRGHGRTRPRLGGAAASQGVHRRRCRRAIHHLAQTRRDRPEQRFIPGIAGLGEHRADAVQLAMVVLPLFHIYALTAVMLRCFENGALLMLRQRFDVDTALDDIERGRCTNFAGVPTIWIELVDHPRIGAADLSSLQVCSSGGAALPPEILSRFGALTGLPIGGGWGMTETSPAGTNLVPGRPPGAGEIGVPLPGVDLDVAAIDDPARSLPPGQTGELRVRGPNVTSGYWQRDGETASAFCDGWFLTGDIGHMSADGVFTIVDRKKDMLISSGFNVYPRAIEDAIHEHPDVREAAVIGVPDPYRGQAAKAFVALREGAPALTLEALRAFLADKLGRHELPAALEIRDELPHTSVGKLAKRELMAEIADAPPLPT